MNTGLEDHVPEESFEAYAMGELSPSDCAALEEHLLLCSTCQTQLEDLEEYIRLMRAALVSVEVAETPAGAKKLRPRCAAVRVLDSILPLTSEYSPT